MASRSEKINKKAKVIEELENQSRIGGEEGIDYDLKFLKENPDHADYHLVKEHERKIEEAKKALAN